MLATPTLYKIIESELFKMGYNQEIVDNEGNLTFFDNNFQVMPKILAYDNDIMDIMEWLFMGYGLDDPAHDMHFKKIFFFRFLNRGINRQTIEAFQMELINTFLTNESYINRVYKDMNKYILQTQETESNNYSYNENYNNQNTTENNTEDDTHRNTHNSKQNTTENNTQTNNEDTKENRSDNVSGDSTNDSRNANATMPQDSVNLNVDNYNMTTADSNEVSRSKQTNNQDTTGETTGKRTGETKGNSTGKTTGETTDESLGNRTGERIGESEGYSNSETEGHNDSISRMYHLEELFKSSTVMENIMIQFDKKCFLQTW